MAAGADPAELVALLIEGARYDDMEDVESALSAAVDLNGTDGGGRTGARRGAAPSLCRPAAALATTARRSNGSACAAKPAHLAGDADHRRMRRLARAIGSSFCLCHAARRQRRCAAA
jgi:hypothetical protein